MAKKNVLGRGLDALITINEVESQGSTSISEVELSKIFPNPDQPRRVFDEESLEELAISIRKIGLIQPVTLRREGEDTYQIIAGERRFRAAQLAGLKEVPVLVRAVSDEHAAVMALIENIQREDLNPLEEAHGVQRLLNEFGLTHEQAAQAIGRSRSATSNLLRLLNLAQPVQTMLLAGDIDMGHARALLAVDAANQIMLANEVIAKRMSVRDTEKLVGRSMRAQDEQTAPAAPKKEAEHAGDIKRMEEALSDKLGTRVTLKVSARKRGQLIIDFHGWDHLNALLEQQGLHTVIEE